MTRVVACSSQYSTNIHLRTRFVNASLWQLLIVHAVLTFYQGDWSSLYAPGEEIQEHLESIVARYKLEPYLNLSHELTHARYDEQGGKWHVTIKRPSSTNLGQLEEFEDNADLLFMGTGILNRWKWPDIDGLHEFKGPLVHSANWNLGGKTWEEDVKDWHDKRIAVIGLVSQSFRLHDTNLISWTVRDPLLFKSSQHCRTKWVRSLNTHEARPGYVRPSCRTRYPGF